MPDSTNAASDLEQRKFDHLTLCATKPVEARERTTLLHDVTLLHDALPELDHEALDLSTTLLGRTLRAPLLITGMTGGVGSARDVNRRLAATAERYGLAFGVGSQRAMLRDPGLTATYQVRDIAPTVLLLGNIGAVQAASLSTVQVADLVAQIGADALCVHLNPAQEMIQDNGDRDFRGCLDAIRRLRAELAVPVIVKETGCGLSPRTLLKLQKAGITTVDVAGSGGTSWVGVETHRASPSRKRIGEVLWDWGVPTAAAVTYARRAGMEVIASGGIRNGQDAAHALALGARVVGAALPFLRSVWDNPRGGATEVVDGFLNVLRTVMLLTGSPNLQALAEAPRVIGPDLRRWIDGAV